MQSYRVNLSLQLSLSEFHLMISKVVGWEGLGLFQVFDGARPDWLRGVSAGCLRAQPRNRRGCRGADAFLCLLEVLQNKKISGYLPHFDCEWECFRWVLCLCSNQIHIITLPTSKKYLPLFVRGGFMHKSSYLLRFIWSNCSKVKKKIRITWRSKA